MTQKAAYEDVGKPGDYELLPPRKDLDKEIMLHRALDFFPLPLFFALVIDSSGSTRIRERNFREHFWNVDGTLKYPDPNLQEYRRLWIYRVDRALRYIHDLLLRQDQRNRRTKGYDDRKIWELAKLIYPIFRRLSPGELHIFPKNVSHAAKNPGSYFNQTAFLYAHHFRSDWLLSELPQTYHQRLGVSHEVALAQSLADIIAMYGESGIRRALQVDFEICQMLGFTGVAALLDITFPYRQNALLELFRREVIKNLSQLETLYLGADLDTRTRELRIVRTSDTESDIANFNLKVTLTVRRVERTPIQVMLDSREKEISSAVFKALRGRELPLKDVLGVTFTLKNKLLLDKFVNWLRSVMPDWTIEKEEKETRAMASGKTIGVKYYGWRKADEYLDESIRQRVEIMIDWMTEQSGVNIGPWVAQEYGTDNHHVYRIRQLLQVAESIWPFELYGVVWSSPDVRRELINHAHLLATGIPVT